MSVTFTAKKADFEVSVHRFVTLTAPEGICQNEKREKRSVSGPEGICQNEKRQKRSVSGPEIGTQLRVLKSRRVGHFVG